MVAVNSLLYFLLSAGLSSNPDQVQDIAGSDPLIANGLDLTKLCPPNEQLSECEAHCQKNCTNFAKPFPCSSFVCYKGCVCKEGLVRDLSGKCVDTKKCPGRDTCPRGEHYEQCSAHCQHNCTTWFKPGPCLRICAHGCVCDKGTIRGPKGKCIKPEKCPKKGSVFEEESSQEELSESFCPPNEEYSRCSAHCQRDCSNWADEDFKCTKNCVPGCVCKEGGVRGPGGRCIFPRQCPPREVEEVEEIPVEEASKPSCPKNEVFSDCEAHCQKNCTNYKSPIPCPKICVKGCVCAKGLVRALGGKCVAPKQCPGKDTCPKGEHYDQCKAGCQTNCTTYGRGFECDWNHCVHGCVCDRGTIRGPDDKCIKYTQCPSKPTQPTRPTKPSLVCPKNEVFSECEAHCQKNCTNYKKPFACPKICVRGCVCDKGLVRGPDGKCVSPKKGCPGKDICPKGEHYDQCKAGCQANCTTYGGAFHCDRNTCVHGCVCNLGTIRGPKGKCIKPTQCPKKSVTGSSIESSAESIEQDYPITEDADEIVCPKYEHLDVCGAHCQKNCSNFDRPMPCPYVCIKGCVCDEGYVRAKDGKCVKPEQCPSVREVCLHGEHFDMCQAHCQKTCTNWHKPIACPFMCVRGCVCDEGTVRGPHGLCIKVDKCPEISFAESQEQGVGSDEGYPEECTLEKEVGPCRARIPRYFFDQETRQCETFYFGGCEGNKNNFVTKEACERRCRKMAEPVSSLTFEEQSEDISYECALEKDKGPCRGNFPRFFFNKETGKCEQFIYGGCLGNRNNFETKGLCERSCLSGSRSSAEIAYPEESQLLAEELPTECTLEKVTGPCKAHIPRYFFNKETNQCEKFIYGGCGGNENNFMYKSTCRRKCLSGSRSSVEMTSQEESEVQAEELPTRCTFEKAEGPCDGHFIRYFFNKETNKCEQFIYGGCRGNENRFLTKGVCERNCLSGSRTSVDSNPEEESEVRAEELPEQCTLDKEAGPCRGNFPRFYFNKETNKCEYFIYGGCQGNENRFLSKRMCERRCLRDSRSSAEITSQEQSEVQGGELPTECTLEKIEGPCFGFFPRYFFNNETNKCEKFIYGGCGGNANNFWFKSSCEKKCLSDPRTSVDSNPEEESEVKAEELPEQCTLDKEEGPCRGNFPRFFFNKETEKCEQFIYGGCQGNENRFLSKRMCERRCLRDSRTASQPNYEEESEIQTEGSSDVSSREESEVKAEDLPRECTLPKKAGPCHGYFPRYYYNKDTYQCHFFLYGGCQGNENNFETYEQCEQKCPKSELP